MLITALQERQTELHNILKEKFDYNIVRELNNISIKISNIKKQSTCNLKEYAKLKIEYKYLEN